MSDADHERLAWFAGLVRQMRRAQRDYFKDRSPADLRASKDLERRVDEAVAGVLDPRQGTLSLGDPPRSS